jgi:AraC-like DNA-binding protein
MISTALPRPPGTLGRSSWTIFGRAPYHARVATVVPTYEAPRDPGRRTAIDLQRFDTDHARVRVGLHGHRDLELLYFERGGGRHSVAGTTWPARAGDVVLIAPGQVHDLTGLTQDAIGWAVEFSPHDIRDLAQSAGPLLLWRSNPLLYPFVAAEVDPDIARFRVAPADRERWERRLRELHHELAASPEGHGHAIAALLLLVLVDVARLARDVPGEMRGRDEPLLARVFEVIETRFVEPLSLRDVAEQVGLTPGYLTTLVRERTGRTVGDWILDRRLAEARTLLLGTDLTVEAVAMRVGFHDPAYFSRRFRLAHDCAPGAWRRAAGA